MYTCSAIFTALYSSLAPAWPQYCQPIKEELRVFYITLIGPIDGLLAYTEDGPCKDKRGSITNLFQRTQKAQK